MKTASIIIVFFFCIVYASRAQDPSGMSSIQDTATVDRLLHKADSIMTQETYNKEKAFSLLVFADNYLDNLEKYYLACDDGKYATRIRERREKQESLAQKHKR